VDAVKELFWEGREIAVMKAARRHCLLYLCKLTDYDDGLRFEALIAGARIHQQKCRKKVAEAVTTQLDIGRLPSSVWFGRRRHPSSHAKHVQKPIRFDRQKDFVLTNH